MCVKELEIRITIRITNFKKLMIMKKIVLTVVAMMALTFSFAETKSNEVDKRFDMNCSMYRLSIALDLDESQLDEVEEIQNSFSDEMQSLATLKGPRLRYGIHQAVRRDAQQMKQVLNDKQFNTYMLILFTTLRNRHL